MNGEKGRIAVVGLDGGPLGEEARELVSASKLVAGGRRQLRALDVRPDRAVVLEGDLASALSRLEEARGGVAVLASGDPGFFGIVRLLSERFGSHALRVLPAVSSVARLFARVGLPWEDAVVVSAHGRNGRSPRRAANVCRAYPKVAVLTSPVFGPVELAAELEGEGRTFVVGERLGERDERVVRGDGGEIPDARWGDPNVVLVLDEGRAVGPKAWKSGPSEARGWGLPIEKFDHRSAMITKPETRALVLARLAPAPGEMVWDVGAGSASVAIECARLGAATVAIERDAESCVRIRRNVARHGVYTRVVEGPAPEALDGLPEPDAVFVGGTGGGFEETLKSCASRALRTVVLTLVSLERVVPAGQLLEACGFEVETVSMQISRLRGVGPMHRLAPETPVFVVVGNRP